jgi:hypothetical protein
VTAVVTASATLASVAAADSASAAITQCGVRGNWFSGYWYDPAAHADNFEGASGYITIQPIHTCTNDQSSPNPSTRTLGTNVVSDWVMIASYDGLGWSQAGEIAGYNGTPYAWAEVAPHFDPSTGHCSPACFDRFLGVVNVGDRDAFTERFQYCGAPTNNYCVESLFNGTRITDTNFNPFDGMWAQRPGGGSGWSPEFMGEKWYQASDIPGTASQHANYQFIGAQRYTDNVSENMPCELTGMLTATRAAYKAANCYTFDIWTTSPT